MSNTVKKTPMYFTSLKVKNVKSFGEEQELSLMNKDGSVARWTLILGDNGIGKTTLLKCLAWMVPVPAPPKKEYVEQRRIANSLYTQDIFKEGIDKVKKIAEITGISEEDIRNSGEELSKKVKPIIDDLSFDVEVYDKIVRKGEETKTRLISSFSNNCQLGERPSQVITISIDFARQKGKIEVVEPHPVAMSEFNTPNLFAYSASRHLARKNFENKELSDPTFNLLSDLGELYDPEQVLAYLDYAASKEKIENLDIEDEKDKKYTSTILLETLKQLLSDLLPDVNNAASIIINPPIGVDGAKNERIIEIQTDHGRIPLFNVSLGYQTMLSWAVDLAIRMLWLNPESKKPLEEPAVVIIDEIDLHLHPIWQRNLKKFLIDHFTNTQFICTAHSPFMAQSSETENICVVYKNHFKEVIIDSNPDIVKGWRIGQIATSELFGVPIDRSPEIEREINERRKILDRDKPLENDESELSRLNEELDNIPILENKEDQELLNQIRKAAELLKEKGALNDSDK